MLVSQEGAAGAAASGRDLSKAIAALPQEALDGLVDSIVAAAPPPPQPKLSNKKAAAEQLIDDLPLFAALQPATAPQHAPAAAGPHPLVEALAGIDPDDMTPREALEALYRLKQASREAD